MITVPASSRSFRGSHPSAVAAHQRLSGRSHSARNDRSTITSPTVETTRSRTQIGPGIHGAIPDPNHHNHSPPALTRARVQISASGVVVLTIVGRGCSAYAGPATDQRDRAPAYRPGTSVRALRTPRSGRRGGAHI